MRLFLAIDIPKKIKQAIEDQIDPLKKEYPQFEWVPKENYHLTIHFFGERNDIKEIKNKIEQFIFDKDVFYLYGMNIDLFMNQRIVLYMNFRREKNLEEIAERIKEYYYMPDHRIQRFMPHLTIARCRIPSKQQYLVLKKRIGKIPVDISFPVKKLILFESQLGGKFPVYNKISQLPLINIRT